MDSKADRNVALLSIYPEFVERIFDGSKKIELRRISLPTELKHVVVYSTSPVMKIVGYFDVSNVIRDKPSKIWKEYGDVAGIDKRRFFDYYESRDTAVGILIHEIHPLPTPRKLSFLSRSLTPPQSVTYLPDSAIVRLQSHIAKARRAA